MSERNDAPNVAEEKPKTITKFKRRISRILGKDDVKNATQATSSTAPAAIDKPAQEPAPAKVPAEAPKKAVSPKPTTVAAKPKVALSASEHAKIQEEKVRALFAKYNVTLEVGEWTQPFKSDIPRVEKKIRMRVHRSCHRCRTQFGIDKVCTNCTHACCKKCPRYPTKKVEKAVAKDGTTVAKGDPQYVKRPATQRTRMMCHKCQTPFKSKSKECGNCQHERCSECRRSLPKGDTAGGAGTAKLPRSFVKWTCHECSNVHRDPEDPCLKCGHGKCEQCSKEKVQRAAPPEGSKVKDLEAKMKSLGVSSEATAA